MHHFVIISITEHKLYCVNHLANSWSTLTSVQRDQDGNLTAGLFLRRGISSCSVRGKSSSKILPIS